MDFTKQEAHPPNVSREVHMEQALALRIRGYSYRKIAKSMGVVLSYAYDLVVSGLQETKNLTAEHVEELRTLELARLDDMWQKLYPTLPKDAIDAKTANTLIRISERRAALTGMDAPKFMPMGGGALPYVGPFDLDNLSLADLRNLEIIVIRASGGDPGTSIPGLAAAVEVFPDPEPEPLPVAPIEPDAPTA